MTAIPFKPFFFLKRQNEKQKFVKFKKDKKDYLVITHFIFISNIKYWRIWWYKVIKVCNSEHLITETRPTEVNKHKVKVLEAGFCGQSYWPKISEVT